MRIAVVGGSGMIGAPIAAEAAQRGHEVTVVTRSAGTDATDPASLAEAIAGHDVVISAVSARRAPLTADDVPEVADPDEDWSILQRVLDALLIALPRAGVDRLVWVGGSGSLEVTPGVSIIDTPEFGVWPEAFAHRDALHALQDAETDLRWTAFSAPHDFAFGGRGTGAITAAASDQVLRNADGESRGTIGDAATAIIDEVEQDRFPRQRFTITVER